MQRKILGLFMGMMALVLMGCPNPTTENTNSLTSIAFSAITANGTPNTISTTALTLTFDADPTNLTIDDITLVGASKGVLSGTGVMRTLTISDIIVANAATVSVALANPSGLKFTPESRDVAVNVSVLFSDNFENYTSLSSLQNVWNVNDGLHLSYEYSENIKYSGNKAIIFKDNNNGDRANIQTNYTATIIGLVEGNVYLPSINQPDLAEFQLQGVDHSVSEVVTVQLTRNDQSEYDLRIQQNASNKWSIIKSGLLVDTWYKIKIIYNNIKHQYQLFLDDTPIGIFPFNNIANISRIELNGGGWNNSDEMDVYFDNIIVQSFPISFSLPDQVISILEVPGVEAPVIGVAPVTTTIDTPEYSGLITWTPTDNPFLATIYTATIVLTAKEGWTLTGVLANSFTVAGASATNTINSGIITAVFPLATKEELIKNCDFKSGFDYWSPWSQGLEGASTIWEITPEGYAWAHDIIIGPNSWDLQLMTNYPINMIQGTTYVLKIIMGSKEDRYIRVKLGENGIDYDNDGSSYTPYISFDFLSKNEKTYEGKQTFIFEFQYSNVSFTNAQLNIDFGNSDIPFQIQEISLTKKE